LPWKETCDGINFLLGSGQYAPIQRHVAVHFQTPILAQSFQGNPNPCWSPYAAPESRKRKQNEESALDEQRKMAYRKGLGQVKPTQPWLRKDGRAIQSHLLGVLRRYKPVKKGNGKGSQTKPHFSRTT
jgi:hypothetical protein